MFRIKFRQFAFHRSKSIECWWTSKAATDLYFTSLVAFWIILPGVSVIYEKDELRFVEGKKAPLIEKLISFGYIERKVAVFLRGQRPLVINSGTLWLKLGRRTFSCISVFTVCLLHIIDFVGPIYFLIKLVLGWRTRWGVV